MDKQSALARIRAQFKDGIPIKPEPPPKPVTPAPFVIKKPVPFLYIMRNERNGYFKIGKSIKPVAREKTLQAEDPETRLILIIPNGGAYEKAVHSKFSDRRVRGEWFCFDYKGLIDLIEYLSTIIHFSFKIGK